MRGSLAARRPARLLLRNFLRWRGASQGTLQHALAELQRASLARRESVDRSDSYPGCATTEGRKGVIFGRMVDPSWTSVQTTFVKLQHQKRSCGSQNEFFGQIAHMSRLRDHR